MACIFLMNYIQHAHALTRVRMHTRTHTHTHTLTHARARTLLLLLDANALIINKTSHCGKQKPTILTYTNTVN